MEVEGASVGLILPGIISVFLLFFLALALLPLYCIIDAARRSSINFERADSNKVLWIVLLFIFHVVAAIVYLVAVRPRLKATATA